MLQSMRSQRVRYKLVTEQLAWDMKPRLRLESSQNSDLDLNLPFFFYLEIQADIRRELFVATEMVKIVIVNRNDTWKNNFPFRKTNQSFNHYLLSF